jgi:hypothetical protein
MQQRTNAFYIQSPRLQNTPNPTIQDSYPMRPSVRVLPVGGLPPEASNTSTALASITLASSLASTSVPRYLPFEEASCEEQGSVYFVGVGSEPGCYSQSP